MINTKNIIIGVSSGIAAYKTLDLIKLLRSNGSNVNIIMTQHATRMIGVSEFIKASGNPVFTSLFKDGFDYREVLDKREVEHIKLSDRADLMVIAPATANIIGKIANGIADDFLTTTVMAATVPVLICPSMNVHMWNNPIVQENLTKLKKFGYFILNPDEGKLACGYEGVGRLRNIPSIAQEIYVLLNSRTALKGKKIMVTAGGTMEPIDPVRYITNKGSGKMGAAISDEARSRGAEALLVRSRLSVSPSIGVREQLFETGIELETIMKKNIGKYDYVFHTAAVSDFIPYGQKEEKIESNAELDLKLKPAEKILHKIKSWNPNIKVIGFKAVYKKRQEELIRIGIEKLHASGSDYIIVNDVGKKNIGFGALDNEVFIISQKGFERKISKTSKREVARKILDFIFP